MGQKVFPESQVLHFRFVRHFGQSMLARWMIPSSKAQVALRSDEGALGVVEGVLKEAWEDHAWDADEEVWVEAEHQEESEHEDGHDTTESLVRPSVGGKKLGQVS